MKTLLLVGGLVLALPGLAQQRPAATPRPVAHLPATPLDEFNNISRGVAAQLRRALRQPSDTRAQQLLQRNPALLRLLEQHRQLKPAFDRWLRPLSEVQRDTLVHQLLRTNSLLQYADSLDKSPGIKARFQRSPALKRTVEWVLYNAVGY